MQSSTLASLIARPEMVEHVHFVGTWTATLRVALFGALVVIMSLVLTASEAQAHGAHASMGSFEQVTPGEAMDPDAIQTENERPPLDCAACCAPAGCLAVAIGVNPAMPALDVPRGAYAISTAVPAYQAARQGLRRPPKLDI